MSLPETLALTAIVALSSQMVGVVLHESFHAAAGRLAGLQLREIWIGYGRPLLQLRVRETTILLGRQWRDGGRVIPYPNLVESRWQGLVFVAAGPLAQLLLIFAIDLVYRLGSWPKGADPYFVVAMIIQGLMFVRSAVPANIKTRTDVFRNDGGLILDLLRRKSGQDRQLQIQYINYIHASAGRSAAFHGISPASARICYHLFYLPRLQGGGFTASTIAAMERELARGLQPAEEIVVLDYLATQTLYADAPEMRPRLDRWTCRAIELLPESKTLRGTRGAALIQLGRFVEAQEMLEQAEYGDSFNRLLNHIFLAQAMFGQGHTAKAHDFLKMAEAYFVSGEAKREGPVWSLMEGTARKTGYGFAA